MRSPIKLTLALCCSTLLTLLHAGAGTIQVQVGAGGLKFTPKDVTVHVGDTVQWVWAGNDHSTTSGTPGQPDGIWDSGILNRGATFSHTFTTAGSFAYNCTVHGSCCAMVGSVAVTSATDAVTITAAQYNTALSQLLVKATDTDPTAILTVSVTSTGTTIGTLTNKGNGTYQGKFSGIANPVNITVTSNLGGSATAPVRTR